MRQGIEEYCKRISKYAKISVEEVPDEKTKEDASEKEDEIVKNKEGEALLSKINERDYCIALAIKGKTYDSVGFSKHLSDLMLKGEGSLCFIIGGSLGLSKAVMDRADETLSFSDFTFPHQLMRMILTEQIYRAFRIMKNEPYHK